MRCQWEKELRYHSQTTVHQYILNIVCSPMKLTVRDTFVSGQQVQDQNVFAWNTELVMNQDLFCHPVTSRNQGPSRKRSCSEGRYSAVPRLQVSPRRAKTAISKTVFRSLKPPHLKWLEAKQGAIRLLRPWICNPHGLKICTGRCCACRTDQRTDLTYEVAPDVFQTKHMLHFEYTLLPFREENKNSTAANKVEQWTASWYQTRLGLVLPWSMSAWFLCLFHFMPFFSIRYSGPAVTVAANNLPEHPKKSWILAWQQMMRSKLHEDHFIMH